MALLVNDYNNQYYHMDDSRSFMLGCSYFKPWLFGYVWLIASCIAIILF